MLSPLRFEPIFKANLWGGTRLRPWLGAPPCADATGEAWLLSDVDGSASRVKGGPFAGRTLRELMAEHGEDFLGTVKPIDGRFPLLLKFIDAKQELSVQVHPNDAQARAKHPTAAGKTEAWVILEANPATSRIYSGFKSGTTPEALHRAMQNGNVAETLHQFVPESGDCVFLPAGTVHAIGADILLFEVQQTSDITYRLFDWNRVDAKTGQPRELHIEDGLACSDFSKGPSDPVVPGRRHDREILVDCEYFRLDRATQTEPQMLGGDEGLCYSITVISGRGTLDGEPVSVGETILVPARCRESRLVPEGTLTTLMAIPRTPR